jgi:hypothetical protein
MLNQENIVAVVGMILEWAINQYVKFDQISGTKELFYARNLQSVINECLLFFLSVLRVTYLCFYQNA